MATTQAVRQNINANRMRRADMKQHIFYPMIRYVATTRIPFIADHVAKIEQSRLGKEPPHADRADQY